MNDFRTRFTKWYYRKGYRMIYKPCNYADGVAELIFCCPWWVRLLVGFFFSPSVYYNEVGSDFTGNFIACFEQSLKGE